MKTVFIINPAAGKGKNISRLTDEIKKVSQRLGADTDICLTECIGDAGRIAERYSKEYPSCRIIACGGDGTLSEVVNGCMGNPLCEVGVMPCGTGNDFCRNFDADFLSIEKQLTAGTMSCDVMKYKTRGKTAYCINMFNIGFDCNVADYTNRLKKSTFIKGTIAYLVSIFVILLRKRGANLSITTDCGTEHHGKLLLTSMANGCFCGGGVKSNPEAQVSDGLINMNIVKDIPRRRFVSLLPYYINGTFRKVKNIENVISSFKCRKVTIKPLEGTMRLCVDGEIYHTVVNLIANHICTVEIKHPFLIGYNIHPWLKTTAPTLG